MLPEQNKKKLTSYFLSLAETEFLRYLTQSGYVYQKVTSQKLIHVKPAADLLVFSYETAFYYAQETSRPLTKGDLKFAYCGEFVHLSPLKTILVQQADASLYICSKQKFDIGDLNTLDPTLLNLAEDFQVIAEPYYLGYEKRYAKVYEEGGTSWEAPTPNKSLMRLLTNKPNLLTNKKIIDLGCGEGRDTIFLTRQGFDVTGVDISLTALKKARKLALQAHLQPQFLAMNVLYLNGLSDETFDIAFNMGCLHMITNPEERRSHIQNVNRILKKDGLFIIDHCEANWGKGFYSLPPEIYRPADLVVGKTIPRRVRTKYGETHIPLEVIPYAERTADELCAEIMPLGFKESFRFQNKNEAFGESVLIAFKNINN